jgi:hypothetical protein
VAYERPLHLQLPSVHSFVAFFILSPCQKTSSDTKKKEGLLLPTS